MSKNCQIKKTLWHDSYGNIFSACLQAVQFCKHDSDIDRLPMDEKIQSHSMDFMKGRKEPNKVYKNEHTFSTCIRVATHDPAFGSGFMPVCLAFDTSPI